MTRLIETDVEAKRENRNTGYRKKKTFWDVSISMIGKADIEGSQSNVAMNALLPQASDACGNNDRQ